MIASAGLQNPVRQNLGINAKSRDIRAAGQGGGDNGIALQSRRTRLDLTRTSGALLFEHGKEAKEQFRVCWCHRGIQTKTGQAPVYRRTDGGGARLGGVIRCGSVWTCPTCALPVSEERRADLEAGVKAWSAKGGHVYLLTLTFPHVRDDPLADIMGRMQKAMDRFRTGRAYRTMRERYEVAGVVKGLEATWGVNGWHPHLHLLVFGKPGLNADRATHDALASAWVGALEKVGLCPHSKITWAMEHALDLRGGDKAAEYVAKFGREEKWGMSSELTRHQAKVGARGLAGFDGHVTPFQILDWARSGDSTAVRLWREFADVFHGKRQLVYSQGLKDVLGIRDRDDQDIVEDDARRPEEVTAGTIDQAQLAVLHSRRALGEFLDNVGRYGGDQSDLDAWIAEISTRPRVARGTLVRSGGYSDWKQAA